MGASNENKIEKEENDKVSSSESNNKETQKTDENTANKEENTSSTTQTEESKLQGEESEKSKTEEEEREERLKALKEKLAQRDAYLNQKANAQVAPPVINRPAGNMYQADQRQPMGRPGGYSGYGGGISMPRKSSGISLQAVATVVTIIFMLASIFMLYKDKMLSKGDEDTKTDESEYESNIAFYAKKYGKMTPNECKQMKYAGLNDQFDGFLQTIMPLVRNADSNLTISDAQKNLMLYGKPGTGKTFFVCKLVFMMALNIRAHQVKKERNIHTIRLDRLTDIDRSLVDDLYQCNHLVEMYHIRPKMFLDKHVGETEKHLDKFFGFLSWRQKKIPIVVFVDEAESLLGKRVENSGGGSGVQNNIVTAWLEWLDGAQSRRQERIFVVIATNLKSRLDDGLDRRFANQIGIPLPRPTEIYSHLDKTIFLDMEQGISEKRKQALVKLCEGLSLSRISSVAKVIYNDRLTTRSPASYESVHQLLKGEALKMKSDQEQKEKLIKQSPQEKIQAEAESNPKELISIPFFNTATQRNSNELIINKASLDILEEYSQKETDELVKDKTIQKNVFAHLLLPKHEEEEEAKRIEAEKQAAAEAMKDVADDLEDEKLEANTFTQRLFNLGAKLVGIFVKR
ncbi:hypothetical protein NEOKW01_1135 [Nematocida sp. AWRm80]|nr:hypothetical protein NEOKW01_1135 [Nematocida sp. AWRm80]